jgi:diaminohydroxyphosphoribosylaminopyrimidine deaminase/5-amino-6-(5-phosphoribosylamino)uracil reductase
MPIAPTDLPRLHAALGLARRGLGNTWPNPAVGCVLVKDGVVVGRGWTQPGGRPHAETEALWRAGEAARGATAYVTLEPCSHHGRTPPCADALIQAGVARVVVAIEDPDPRVSGRGLAMLRAAGIAVELCDAPGQPPEAMRIARQAREVNQGFLTRIALGRPMVTLKLATSLDGRIATRTGDSKWITGPAARERSHLLRARHDAVLVGIGTAMADDPRLDCRLPGWEAAEARQPVRLVADSQARLPLSLDLVRRAGSQPGSQPTWLLARADADQARLAALVAAGVEVLPVPSPAPAKGTQLDLTAAFQALGARGLTRVLVEGGGQIAAGLLKAGLVDRMVWFRAPVILGGDGVPAVAGLDVNTVAEAHGFTRISAGQAGVDSVEAYARRPGPPART